MFLLLSYDITGSAARLQKVAHICEKYGVRVQNSVFELDLNISDLTKLKLELNKVIDLTVDSIRIYRLGKNYKSQVELIGVRRSAELSQDDAFFL